MASHRELLAALVGCIVLAGCNGSNNVADTGDTSGTFAECHEGTLVGGKCVIIPAVIIRCQEGTLVDGECIEMKVPVNRDNGMASVEWQHCLHHCRRGGFSATQLSINNDTGSADIRQG